MATETGMTKEISSDEFYHLCTSSGRQFQTSVVLAGETRLHYGKIINSEISAGSFNKNVFPVQGSVRNSALSGELGNQAPACGNNFISQVSTAGDNDSQMTPP